MEKYTHTKKGKIEKRGGERGKKRKTCSGPTACTNRDRINKLTRNVRYNVRSLYRGVRYSLK